MTHKLRFNIDSFHYHSVTFQTLGDKVLIDDMCGKPFSVSLTAARQRWLDMLGRGWVQA